MGTLYFDDGTNTTTGNPGFRIWNGTSWADSVPYSQGSWTPVLQYAANTVTLTVAEGQWMRMGNAVYVNCRCHFTEDITGGTTDFMTMTNLPFAAFPYTSPFFTHADRFNSPAAVYTHMFGQVSGTTNEMRFWWGRNDTGGALRVEAQDADSSGVTKKLEFNGMYLG